MLIFDFIRQDKIQRFLSEHNESGRFKAIANDGCILVYEMLVLGAATRWNVTPESVRKKCQNLRPLAKKALVAPELDRVREMILAMADVRNKADHEPLTDADIRDRLFLAFEKVNGQAFPWKGAAEREIGFARVLFAWIASELARWQVGLPPSHVSK